ncbi:hypothetical protein sscle_13g094960 [Sclerotinia sclerotiorum 1980 UF-70]|uniref:Ribosomal protein YmL11, mitochondrial n=1 Tax=Sclerotinia sclerotiorum (strain ATCC 18683 / 1980 / Ss-1) TaxID=665079 RepID=A0A1D9QIG6_SCLS1|nr:hypothetical protein sscle_13g094960 [Sclerotinia sclerotiorum 1980 UF-70]
MRPRIHTPSKAIASILRCKRTPLRSRQYATAAAAFTPAASHEQMTRASPPISQFPSTQPPSYKPPEFRKSQLLRKYASLLRSTPLMLLFQHNNLKAGEWVAIRRELAIALRKVDAAREAEGQPHLNLADGVKLEIVQTGILAAALRIVEFYKPDAQVPKLGPTNPATPSSATLPIVNAKGDGLTHTLSSAAYEAISAKKTKNAHDLSPLLAGPVVLLTFPGVSPQHLKTALTILSPSAPLFPAPKKRVNPGWHDPTVQSGLQKLLLLGARVEGKVFDVDGTKWVGSIEGGLDGLRAQLMAMLQGIGGGITNVLEGAGKSLYLTVEGRRMMLEDEEKGPSEEPPKE